MKPFLRFTEGKTSVDLRKYGVFRELYQTIKIGKGIPKGKTIE